MSPPTFNRLFCIVLDMTCLQKAASCKRHVKNGRNLFLIVHLISKDLFHWLLSFLVALMSFLCQFENVLFHNWCQWMTKPNSCKSSEMWNIHQFMAVELIIAWIFQVKILERLIVDFLVEQSGNSIWFMTILNLKPLVSTESAAHCTRNDNAVFRLPLLVVHVLN